MPLVKGLTKEEVTKYVKKITAPQYEITGDCPSLAELCLGAKTTVLINEIKKSGVSDEQKQFLIRAAQRHLKFNYAGIAEYYAQSGPEMQALMEKSALVIIDYDDAIMNGYVELSKSISTLIK